MLKATRRRPRIESLDFQKMMHRSLKRLDVFSWIGHPIFDGEWERAFDACIPGLGKSGKFMVSGDYEAATDNLDPRVSEYIWEQICRTVRRHGRFLIDPLPRVHGSDFEPDWPEMDGHSWEYCQGKKALTGHRLSYKDGEVVMQTCGQLMGSPMSFPILCIANAACCLIAMGVKPPEEGSKSWGSKKWLKGLPLRINGDDCCFPADEEQYEDWNSITSSIGLKKSIGKNYTSTEFAIMNSELHVVKGGKIS